jgi:hypothetical protein
MFRVRDVVAISIFLSLTTPAWAAEPMAKEREADKNPGQALQQQGSQTPGSRQEGEKSLGQGVQQQASQPSAGRQSLCQSQAPAKSQGGQEPQASGAASQKGQMLKGQFVRMEGEDYVMQDQGKEVCIRTSYATFIDQTFVSGDIITVRLGPDGTAIVIGRVLDAPGQTQAVQGIGQESGTSSAAQGSGSTREPSMPSGGRGQAGSQDLGPSAEARGQQNSPTVRGEILKIQGEFYTLKDSRGNEVRLHVNKDTKMDSSFQVGDKIEAEQTSSGHAVAIRKASEGGTGPAGSPQPAR